jgi:hypothetical protein
MSRPALTAADIVDLCLHVARGSCRLAVAHAFGLSLGEVEAYVHANARHVRDATRPCCASLCEPEGVHRFIDPGIM